MKRKILTLTAICGFLLIACTDPTGGSTENVNDADIQAETTGGTTSTTNQLSNDYYRAVITDGEYQVSQSRGITLNLNSNFNLKAFEVGLMNLSHEQFPTDSYFFQEGQYLDSSTVNSWLGRYHEEDNPDGLNPEDNGSVEPDERNPIYLESILEQNYMVETDDGFQLSGITIGLAMNSVDYYTQVDFGAEFETQISRDELLAEGREMADTIVQRLREMEGIGDIPIVVGIFEQTAKDNLAGGVFISEAVSENGAASVGEWSDLSLEKVIFPTGSEDSNESTSFENFKSEVENFFPNLSGVTAEVTYADEQLVRMKVEIVTQFYGESEIVAFTQHVADQAATFLPQAIPIEITISSITGTESFLAREAGETEFYSHIFD